MSDFQEVERILVSVADWVQSRPDILGAALLGSWARGEAKPSSDVDLMILAVRPDVFRSDGWLNDVSWPEPARVARWHDENYGAVWSRHIELSGGLAIEFSFAERSWATTVPVDPSTADIVRCGFRILVDKERVFETLKAAVHGIG